MASNTDNVLNLVAFAGSLRRGSYNRLALEAAMENAPAGVSITPLEIRDVPFFDGDVENAGDPSSVTQLKDAVRESDGLVIFTPEYNGSVSAVTKNAIDWLSRKTGEFGSPVTDKPVAIAAVSPGGRGAPEARSHLIHVVGFMTKALFRETLGIRNFSDKVDGESRLSDYETVNELVGWLKRFRNHARPWNEDHDGAEQNAHVLLG